MTTATKADIRRLESRVGELASISLQMAKRVYNADDEDMMPYEDDEEEIMDLADDEEVTNPLSTLDMDKADDDEDDPDEMYKRYKAAKARVAKRVTSKRRQARKGYADSAEVASNEEDSKWDEKDADVEGNEVQPQGEGNLEDPHDVADREDETFGPGGMAYSAMLKEIKSLSAENAQLKGGTVVKDITPGSSGFNKGREVGEGTGGLIVTRDMEEQAKTRSYKDLNRLRTETGDLPRFAGLFN